MFAVLLLVCSIGIFVLLKPINGVLALAFLILSTVSIPAVVIHRREAAYGPEVGLESESISHGWLRLAQIVTVDLSGVFLGVLLLILIALMLRLLVASGIFH